MKKSISVFLSLVMLLSCMAFTVFAEDGVVTIEESGAYVVSDCAGVVVKGAEVELTLQDAAILSAKHGIEIIDGASVTLNIVGVNTVMANASEICCGIYVMAGSSLTICGDGSLTVTGGKYGAAIGSYGTSTNLPKGEQLECGDITVNSGNIYAYGGEKGAGIGSGYHVSAGNITINGGTVYAYGNGGGAGIGSGYGTSGGAPEVEQVGFYHGGVITINGGKVYAATTTAVDFATFNYMDPSTFAPDSCSFAAGIGGGYGASSGVISIMGGEVTAVGSCGGAGIGSGRGTSKGTKYSTEHFFVDVTIGGDAKVIACAPDDTRNNNGGGAGIGSGRGTHTGGTISILDNAEVIAVGSPYANAIGCGAQTSPVDGSTPVAESIVLGDSIKLYAITYNRDEAVDSNASSLIYTPTVIGHDNTFDASAGTTSVTLTYMDGETEYSAEYTVPQNTSSLWANINPASVETGETISVDVVTPAKMSVRFEDGTVYKTGDSVDVEIGKVYKFQMCSNNWDNDTYTDDGNGICGTVVYSLQVVHEKDFVALREVAVNDPERYTVKGMDIIDNYAHAIIINCDAGNFHLETDVNNFFVAYRFHFTNGDYNKQTGIANVVNTPLESLSVNLPLGSTVTCDAYKAYSLIDSADVFIENNNGEGVYEDVYLTSVNDYYWPY